MQIMVFIFSILLASGGYVVYEYVNNAPPVEMKLSAELMGRFKSISPIEIEDLSMSYWPSNQCRWTQITGKGTSMSDDYAVWGCIDDFCPSTTITYKDDSTVIVDADAKKTEYSKEDVFKCVLKAINIDPQPKPTSEKASNKVSWSK